MNWFKYNLHKLRQEYLRYIGKPQDIAECIKIYNKLKETQYLDIATSKDLFEVVRQVIDKDLRKWVEAEGAYEFIQNADAEPRNHLFKKLLRRNLKTTLLKKG